MLLQYDETDEPEFELEVGHREESENEARTDHL